MDDKLDRLKQEQKVMQAEMRSKFEKIEADIASSQLNMLHKLEDLFNKHVEKSHAGNPVSSKQDSIPPPGITIESGPPPGFVLRAFAWKYHKNFSDLVISGELIENAIKSGKIEVVDGSSSKKPVYWKKENEVNNTSVYNKNTSKNVTITKPIAERNDTNITINDSSGPWKENKRMSFTPLPVPYSKIYTSLLKADVVRPYRLNPLQFPYPHWYDINTYCDYYDGIAGHSIENCLAFKKVIQNLINTRGLQFDSPDVSTHPLPNHGGKGVDAVHEDNRRKVKTVVDEIKSPFSWVFQQLYQADMIRQDPKPKLHECGNYCEYHQEEGHIIQLYPEFRGESGSLEETKVAEENNKTPGSSLMNEIVSEVGYFTKSGRCYSPETSKEIDNVKAKGKATAVPQKIFDDEPPPLINDPVIKAQTQEFLKFLIHSDYSVVDQLHKQQARILILDLLINSYIHRNALLRVLNQTFVPEDITVNKLDQIVGHIAADNYITFTDDEIPDGGMRSVKSLNITTYCHDHVLLGVLIYNESTLNVMPMTILRRLPVDSSHMRAYQNVVRAFDRTLRDVLGKIELISIGAEEEIIASLTTDTPYVETNENALECSFRALEFVNTTFIVEVNKIPRPRLSDCTKMTVRETLGKGAKIGKGLDRLLQGTLHPKFVMMKRDRFGLGFEPDFQQRKKELKKRCEVRRARLKE
ncbi:uncharacterized protein LOC120184589 [Hibiscus syriacus]|uniref:uncharacterized protein LOC120184589 n=1 Tax=Hibiscus syriacus TaxID=106335 RepID=UPI001920BDF4|nr:uncharacterized protein LOC120184589 [Hibiscus syriacus]